MPRLSRRRLGLAAEQAEQADAEHEAVKVRDALRLEVANLAVKGAEQILHKEINAAAHADLLERLKAEL